jgi:outer membrane protein assembly factor BamE
LLGIALGLAGCGASGGKDALFGVVTPYKITIVQGNVVTREQAAMVKPGMTRSQVREILGTPMLMDIFHADRWDYVFTIRRGSNEPQRRAVVAHFKGDSLDRLEAADLPSEREFVAELRPGQGGGTPPTLELTEEQRRALPAPARGESRSAPPVGAIRTYPPLEPS